MRVVALASLWVLVLSGTLRAADVVTVSAYDAQFTAEQRTKLEGAVSLANHVLASPEFRARLDAITRFNLSADDGAAVRGKLLARAYTLKFEAVAKYAVRIGPIRRKSAMVAVTGEGSGQITFNTVRMPEFDQAFYAGTVAHELCHIAGYRHSGNKPTAFNQGTVPYRVGELVRELAERLPTTVSGGISGRIDGDSGTTAAPSAGDTTPAPSAGSATPPAGDGSDDSADDADDSADDADDADDSADAGSGAAPRPTFLARVRATLRRLFRRRGS
ncbi:MAG: hypothetical protein AB7N76_08700 [Planctomycetota bacterium]